MHQAYSREPASAHGLRPWPHQLSIFWSRDWLRLSGALTALRCSHPEESDWTGFVANSAVGSDPRSGQRHWSLGLAFHAPGICVFYRIAPPCSCSPPRLFEFSKFLFLYRPMTSASYISAQSRHWHCIRWPLENRQRHLLLPSESRSYSLAQSISRRLSWLRSYAQSASGLLNRWEQ